MNLVALSDRASQDSTHTNAAYLIKWWNEEKDERDRMFVYKLDERARKHSARFL